MGDLVKLFKHFITRDALYIIGGACVIASFLYAFDRLPEHDPGTAYTLLGASIAYVVGYAIQDGLSLTPLVTTANIREPGSCVRWLYERWTHQEWCPVGDVDIDAATDRVLQDPAEQELGEFQRIVTLRFIGTAVGPCAVLSGAILLTKSLLCQTTFDLALGDAAFLLGLDLVALGWIKGIQQTDYVVRSQRRHEKAQADGQLRKDPS